MILAHHTTASSRHRDVPVLFLVFNRPEITERTFACIREAAPTRLFIHADGPRPDRPEDAERCARVRLIVQAVDWPCKVSCLFRETNLGCGLAVAEALDWFFSGVDEGAVLEDDCLPRPGFFSWCARQLELHRHDPAVFQVSGMGFALDGLPTHCGGFRSPLPFIWGWATWGRAWRRYRRELPSAAECEPVLRRLFPDRGMRAYWREKLDLTRAGEIRTWDYQWVWTHWAAGASAIVPVHTLVDNIGFGLDSTHTASAAVGYAPTHDSPPLGPIFSPEPVETLRAVHTRIFAPTVRPRTFANYFRSVPALAYVYLGLRRRALDLKRAIQRR